MANRKEIYNDYNNETDFESLEWVLQGIREYFEDKEVLIVGTLQLWNGKVNIADFGEFEYLYCKAIKDCDYLIIYEENGHFYLDCTHHDGKNHFEIREITDKGREYIARWNYSNRNYKKVCEQLEKRYSKRPLICKNVFGE